VRNARFAGSSAYWDRRYRDGGTSGDGSYGELAELKARTVNAFVAERGARTVLELGCGDGNQLGYGHYDRYIGLDVSRRAIELCTARFAADPTKSFFLYDPAAFFDRAGVFTADCALSLDVIFHLVEDTTYAKYLADLFGCARDSVVIYSSNHEQTAVRVREAPHVRHRAVTRDIAQRFPAWQLVREIANPFPERSFASFFMYARRT
jgi:SAM-dependent methyltransferase